MRGGCQTCSGSGPSFLNRPASLEFKVQRTPGPRGGGASLKVSSPTHLSAICGWCQYLTCVLLTSPPGVDDAESECGLDSGVEFDWIITHEVDAPPLGEQLQPILQLAQEAINQSRSPDQ